MGSNTFIIQHRATENFIECQYLPQIGANTQCIGFEQTPIYGAGRYDFRGLLAQMITHSVITSDMITHDDVFTVKRCLMTHFNNVFVTVSRDAKQSVSVPPARAAVTPPRRRRPLTSDPPLAGHSDTPTADGRAGTAAHSVF